MDKIKFGLFDIFVYTVPGLLYLFAIYLVSINLKIGLNMNIESFLTIVDKISVNMTLIILLLSYCLGFAFHLFGYNYFNRLGKRIWKKVIKGNKQSLSVMENEFVLLRHHSKENFVYVEQWMAYRGMSFNLSLSFLTISLVLILKSIISLTFGIDWLVCVIGLIFLSAVTLRRAVTFHIWSINTLNEAVKTLGLKDKKND